MHRKIEECRCSVPLSGVDLPDRAQMKRGYP